MYHAWPKAQFLSESFLHGKIFIYAGKFNVRRSFVLPTKTLTVGRYNFYLKKLTWIEM